MKMRLYVTLAEAEAARRALDAAAGLPYALEEGTGPTNYRISRPGQAAGRIRARGVRLEHAVAILANHAATAFGIVTDTDTDPEAVEVDRAVWFGPIRRVPPP